MFVYNRNYVYIYTYTHYNTGIIATVLVAGGWTISKIEESSCTRNENVWPDCVRFENANTVSRLTLLPYDNKSVFKYAFVLLHLFCTRSLLDVCSRCLKFPHLPEALSCIFLLSLLFTSFRHPTNFRSCYYYDVCEINIFPIAIADGPYRKM